MVSTVVHKSNGQCSCAGCCLPSRLISGSFQLLQVVDNEGGGLPGVSEQDRLAAERAIACQLLPITYDGSPLVRAELAAALARFATGHVVLFKVCSSVCYSDKHDSCNIELLTK